MSSVQLAFRETAARAFVEIHPQKIKVHHTDSEGIVITYPSRMCLALGGFGSVGSIFSSPL